MSKLSKNKLVMKTGFLICVGIAARAGATGYEKPVGWSGHYTGIGSAAVSSVAGAEGMYFNPAGISTTKNWDVAVDFSPTFPKFNQPTLNSTTTTGTRTFLPVFGVTASKAIDDRFSAGLGFYVAGGASAKYDSVNPASLNARYSAMGAQTVETSIHVTELALGGSYKIIPGWTVGAAYRVVFVSATFSDFAHPMPSTQPLEFLSLTGLSDKKFNGFKVGTQYRSTDNRWGLGADWRSQVSFNASGTANARVDAGGVLVPVPSASVGVANTFPTQLSIGGDYAVTPTLRGFLEYTFTQYSKDQQITIAGSLGGGAIPNITQDWNNLQNFRVGAEYTGFENWALRAGYVFTTQTVPAANALPGFAVPGVGSTVVLGGGTKIMNGALGLDGAIEYSWAKGSANNTAAGLVGDASVNSYSLHLGANYEF